jgi:hypothetical protein
MMGWWRCWRRDYTVRADQGGVGLTADDRRFCKSMMYNNVAKCLLIYIMYIIFISDGGQVENELISA